LCELQTANKTINGNIKALFFGENSHKNVTAIIFIVYIVFSCFCFWNFYFSKHNKFNVISWDHN